MASKAQEIAAKEINDRLQKIAFHFEERETFRNALAQFTGGDNDPKSQRHGDMERAITRIVSEELTTLSELIHLRDNVGKYFRAHALKDSELAVIDNFKPYRIAANYVNTEKHGTRGRNQSSAKVDHHALFYQRVAPTAGVGDKLLDSFPASHSSRFNHRSSCAVS